MSFLFSSVRFLTSSRSSVSWSLAGSPFLIASTARSAALRTRSLSSLAAIVWSFANADRARAGSGRLASVLIAVLRRREPVSSIASVSVSTISL